MTAAGGGERLTLGIVVERRRPSSRWADGDSFVPVAALPGAPAVPPWTVLATGERGTTLFAGTVEVALYRADTANYRDNLGSGRPMLWVVLRRCAGEPPVELLAATADPAEGEAFTEAGGDVVEPVPMPAEVAARLAAFVAAHHVERGFYKRRREPVDPEALGRRRPAGPDDDDDD